MRLHISVDDDVVTALDRRVGQRQRSAFITAAVRRALDDERRWEDISRSVGSLSDAGHDWDEDPASWVREQRYADPRRHG